MQWLRSRLYNSLELLFYLLVSFIQDHNRTDILFFDYKKIEIDTKMESVFVKFWLRILCQPFKAIKAVEHDKDTILNLFIQLNAQYRIYLLIVYST